jgi:hypothetical protein
VVKDTGTGMSPEVYLGKVTDAEPMRWIDVLHSK